MMDQIDNFKKQWLHHYPDSPPVSHWFKWAYPDKWFRIHSLPKSKCYPENDREWKMLFKRQNEIITDLFGYGAEVYLVSSDADWGFKALINLHNGEGEAYSFIHVGEIDLYKINMEYYKDTYMFDSHKFKPIFAEVIWKQHLHDNLLKEIANGNAEAFFVSFDKAVIAAPYDGGVDIIVKYDKTKELYKNKYKKWLSRSENGL